MRQTCLPIENNYSRGMAKMSGFLKCECPQCGQHIEFRVEDSGQSATCPSCQREFVMPTLETKPTNPIPKVIFLTTAIIIFVGLIIGGVIFVAEKHAQKVQQDWQQKPENELVQKQLRDKQEQAEQHKLQEAAQIKADADALLASGRFLCVTDEIDERVTIGAKPTLQDRIGRTGLMLLIGIPKQGKPILFLSADDVTGENSNSERQAISGFDTVRFRIGTNVFSLQKQWSPGNVKIEIHETRQNLLWTVSEDSAANNLLLHILNSDSPIKVEFSSSFMGGSSYTFTMTEKQIQPMKDVFTIYKSLPGAASLQASESSR